MSLPTRLDIPRAQAVLRMAAGDSADKVPLHAPQFAGAEWRYLKEFLDTGWVSSVGAFVDRFERDLAAFIDATSRR